MTAPAELDSIEKLAQDLLAKTRNQGDSRYMLGVTGPPGAGKSTVAQRLHDELLNKHNFASSVVPMDGYHMSNETLSSLGLLHLKGIAETFDAGGFVSLVKRLRERFEQTVDFPTFDRSIESTVENGGSVPVGTKLVIVEGNYLLSEVEPWHQLRCLFDQVWYVDEPEEVLLPRLLQRHMDGGKTADQAKEKVDSTDLPNAIKIASTKHLATRILRL